MTCFILNDFLFILLANSATLQSANFTEVLNELKNQSKALHDDGFAMVTHFTSTGAGHLTAALLFQLALLSNFNFDLEQSVPSTLRPVDLHILQEGLLHRKNRFAEELSIVEEVLHRVAHNRSTPPGMLSWNLDITLIEEKVRNYTAKIYSEVRNFEVKNLKTMEAKVKTGSLTAGQLKQAAEEYDRITLSLESIEQDRLWAAMVKLANFN